MDIKLPQSAIQVNYKALTPTQHSLFEVGLLIVVLGVFSWFILQPKHESLGIIRTQLTELEDENSRIAESRAKLESLIAKLDTDTDAVKDLDELLPLEHRFARLQLLLEDYAASSGMAVTSINVTSKGDVVVAGNKSVLANPYAGSRTLQKANVSMALTGNYSQFQSFLNKMEYSARLLDITSIDIQNSKGDLLNFSLSVDTYYFGL